MDATALILPIFGQKKAPEPGSSASFEMVGREGFEPSTKRLKVFCSTD